MIVLREHAETVAESHVGLEENSLEASPKEELTDVK